MTAVRTATGLWVRGVGVIVGVALVAAMAIVVGTPGWLVSLLVTSAIVAVVDIGTTRWWQVSETWAAVVVAVLIVAAAGGLVGVTVHERSDARAVAAARAEVVRMGAQTVCRVIERGTPARQAAALAAATGDLADRLRSGATVLGGSGDQAACRPVETGVTSASRGAAEVVALVEVTADGATGERAVTAGLRRVDGRWAVATLQVVR
ncbi:MAG: hypothetical protein PGN29_12765 [Gordonia paraffinivorans]